MNDQAIAAIVGGGGAAAAEFLQWQRERDERYERKFRELEALISGTKGGRDAGEVRSSDPAATSLFPIQSNKKGTFPSTSVAAQAAAGSGGIATLRNLYDGDAHTPAFHRLALAAGGAGVTTGQVVIVYFPVRFARIPSVRLQISGYAPDQEQLQVGYITDGGYAIYAETAMFPGRSYEWDVIVEPR